MVFKVAKRIVLIGILSIGFQASAQIEDVNGNIGIGTDDPQAKLDVDGTTKIYETLEISANGTNDFVASKVLLNSHNDYRGAGIFSLGQTNNWFFGNPYTDHANSFMIGVGAKSEGEKPIAQKKFAKFYINSEGNVGIGTTNPKSRFHISNKNNIGTRSQYSTAIIEDGDASLDIISSSADRWGSVINFIEGNNGNSNTDMWSIARQTTNGYGNSSLNFNFGTTNNHTNENKVSFLSNGNVGIGTTSPQAKLELTESQGGTLRLSNSNTNATAGSLAGKIDFYKEDPSYGKGVVSSISSRAFDLGGSYALDFATGDPGGHVNPIATRMTINYNGNVGIGTTSPTDKLQIRNGFTFHDGGDKVIGFGTSAGLSWLNRNDSSKNGDLDPSKYSGELRYDPDDGYLDLRVANTLDGEPLTAVRINRDRKVGIGTTYPKTKLELDGDFSLSRNRKIRFLEKKGGDYRAYIGSTNGENGDYNSLVFAVADEKEAMRITGNGNVGIGTLNTQGYKLGVNGKIAATEVKVALYDKWPDFVFEDSYQLPTIEEVEYQITTQGHLKDIPSAAEVEQDGFFLGNMNAKLLQKIEELTLYIIQQNKQINQLENQNEELKELRSQFLELTKRMDKLEQ